MLLVLDLLLLVTIMDTYSIIAESMTVIVYLLVGLPLLYIMIGSLVIASYRCWNRPSCQKQHCNCCSRYKSMQHRLSNDGCSSVQCDFTVSRSYAEREPLIRELQEEEDNEDDN